MIVLGTVRKGLEQPRQKIGNGRPSTNSVRFLGHSSSTCVVRPYIPLQQVLQGPRQSSLTHESTDGTHLPPFQAI